MQPVHFDVSTADAGDAQQNAGTAPASAPHDQQYPYITPDDNPSSKAPEKKEDEFSLEWEDYCAIENAAKKADRISHFMRTKGISRDKAENTLTKQVVIGARFDPTFYDDPKREYERMLPEEKNIWRAQALRELRESDSATGEAE